MLFSSTNDGLCQIPILRRYLCGLALMLTACMTLLPCHASAQTTNTEARLDAATITEDIAVERARMRPALVAIVEGGIGVANADVTSASTWPNPDISYTREQTYGAENTLDQYAFLSQRFDFSGARGLRTEAAERRVTAAVAQGRALQAEVSADVRMRFYEVVAATRRQAAGEAWVRQLETAADAIEQREAAGDASSYDRRRIARELSDARAQTAVRAAELDSAWWKLQVFIGGVGRVEGAPWPEVAGELMPTHPSESAASTANLDARPDIARLRKLAEASALDERAADRWWVPAIEVTGGWKGVDLGGATSNGFVAAASIGVPIFDRNQGDAMRAEAEQRLIRGQYERLSAEAAGALKSRQAEATLLYEAADRFRAERLEAAGALVQTAEAGYHGGELGVLELVDAYRTAQEDAQRGVDLEFAARRARIQLELVSGGYSR